MARRTGKEKENKPKSKSKSKSGNKPEMKAEIMTGEKESRKRRLDLSKYTTGMIMECDYWILILTVALVIFGIVMVFSAGYYWTIMKTEPDPFYYLKRQGFFAVVGLVALLFCANFDYHYYRKFTYPIIGASIFFLILVLTPVGTTVNGAARFIYIGPFGITPSEFSKLAVVLFTAGFLANDPMRARKFTQGILPLFAVMALHAGLILMQPNLSTAIVICAIMFGVMIVGGLRLWYMGLMGGTAFGGAMYILNFVPKEHHWYRRITNFIDPFADAQGEGYQVSQSLIALGNGGVKGLGLGNSISKNLYLPEPQNDFILAIIGEELGYIGVALLLIAYLVLIWRCLLVASKAPDKYGMFIATGVGIMLALQVIINVAVVTASMPATGITLPFISYGGTSLITFMGAMGILLNISRHKEAA